jgi:hypothetical protein
MSLSFINISPLLYGPGSSIEPARATIKLPVPATYKQNARSAIYYIKLKLMHSRVDGLVLGASGLFVIELPSVL